MMIRRHEFMKILGQRTVIPAARDEADFEAAMTASAPLIAMLFGNIQTLPGFLERAKYAGKLIMVHIDLIEGVGRDRSGIKFLSQLGARAIISTKQHLIKIARDEGMFCIQRLFLMDSDSLRMGINLLRSFKPDALEVLPGLIPRHAIQQLKNACDIPIFAGGLISTPQDVSHVLQNGVSAVSTSKRELWEIAAAYQAR